MAVKEHSFVLKRGEGLNNKNLIKHTVRDTVLRVDSPRASSVVSAAKTTTSTTKVDAPKSGKPVASKSSYVSHVVLTRQARQTRQRREAGGSNGASKDWDESSTSSPAFSASTVSSSSSGVGIGAGTPPSKPPRLIPSSGYIPKSGYLSKSGIVSGEDSTGDNGRLPKFGSWNNHNEENSPCYTLLFESVAQEKRSGGPIRIHPPSQLSSPAITEDLYNYNPTSVKAARKKRQSYGLLCCFGGSQSLGA